MAVRPEDSVLEIRTGLRRLDFSASEEDQAAVEFVRPQALAVGQRVRVPLGLRDGQLRELIGQPEHVKSEASPKGKTEHLYRLRGVISTARP
jgi:hypothetical protein